jgi:aminotransferase
MQTLAPRTSVRSIEIGSRRPRFQAQRTHRFTESVIREMTRLAVQYGAVNLAQGFPDFPTSINIRSPGD